MRFHVLAVWFLLLWLASCRPPDPPSLPPAEIIHQAAARMSATSGFHFIIDRTGGPAYLDPDETLSFRRAEGDFVAPDRSRAIVRIIAPGLVTDINVISIAETQWQTNVLTGQWEQLPPDWGFNPAVLFDADVGLQAILTTDLSDVVQTEPEKLEDGPDLLLYAIKGNVAGERLYQMSGGLIGPEPVVVELWIAPETFELHRLLVTEPARDTDEPSNWLVDFTGFNQTVDIEPPDLAEK